MVRPRRAAVVVDHQLVFSQAALRGLRPGSPLGPERFAAVAADGQAYMWSVPARRARSGDRRGRRLSSRAVGRR